MKVKCAWCNKVIKKGTGEVNEEVSHDICKHCKETAMPDMVKEAVIEKAKEEADEGTVWFIS